MPNKQKKAGIIIINFTTNISNVRIINNNVCAYQKYRKCFQQDHGVYEKFIPKNLKENYG